MLKSDISTLGQLNQYTIDRFVFFDKSDHEMDIRYLHTINKGWYLWYKWILFEQLLGNIVSFNIYVGPIEERIVTQAWVS